MDVGSWLRGLGLGQYATAFEHNAVDAETLRELTAEDLDELMTQPPPLHQRPLDQILPDPAPQLAHTTGPDGSYMIAEWHLAFQTAMYC